MTHDPAVSLRLGRYRIRGILYGCPNSLHDDSGGQLRRLRLERMEGQPVTTYPMPGPPSNEECTCYERVIPADDPCGLTEGAIESVTPLSCPFHSWKVKSAMKEKTLTDEGCWAFYYHELSERFRENADPDLSKSVVWRRFAAHPHAFEVRYIL